MNKRLASFLKDAWAKELVLVPSFTIGGLTIILSTLSPFIKYATMINQATPYNYPLPSPPHQDDGNMLNALSHPQDPQGRSME
ncbi:NADH dehydrogenase [ubiquinone] 1 alpha subcomplex subunit 3-like [Ursus arctos]|uniref:NADH dehydrogenase [ubiquinone] 1 alpha subcomplex subunit 3-like n=1 Tax=Ursus arctos TaxID=9644 RepID=UPI002017434F|nr:NADH dehydrogenase [ubiquinone] 1 alpha subcomplex subunit 3-like [Ursus arctos]